jgi:hypothetical protein
LSFLLRQFFITFSDAPAKTSSYFTPVVFQSSLGAVGHLISDAGEIQKVAAALWQISESQWLEH